MTRDARAEASRLMPRSEFLQQIRYLVGITACVVFALIPVSHAATAQHIPGNRCRDTRLCINANTAAPRAWEDL